MLSCALCWIFQESSDVSNLKNTFPLKYELSCLFSKNKQNNLQSKMPILKTDSFIWETKSCVLLNYTIICSILNHAIAKFPPQKHLIQRYAIVWIQFGLKTTKIVFVSFLKQNSNKRSKFQKRLTRNFLIFQPITAQHYQLNC